MARAPEPDHLYALFESQGLSLSPDADWAYLALVSNSVQAIRHEGGDAQSRTVSRTSVLSALLSMDTLSAEVLVGHGFSSQDWASQLGIYDLVASTLARPELGSDEVLIRPRHWLPLISVYRDRFANRPLDFAGVLYMLLSSRGEGRLRKRLMAAGLRVDEAREVMEEQLVATSAPATDAAKKTAKKTAKVPRAEAVSFYGAEEMDSEEAAPADVAAYPDVDDEVLNVLTSSGPFAAFGLLVLMVPKEELPSDFMRIAKANLKASSNLVKQRWENMTGSPGDLTPEARHVLESAVELASKVGGGPAAGIRHVIGALLLHQSEDPVESKVFPLPSALRPPFLDHLESRYPDDDLGSWRQLLLPAAPVRYAGFQAEGFEGPDRLGITRHVNALAALMASVELEPPLSIGLFGDWGSGKSFFMHKLQQRIEALAEDASRRQDRGLERGFHPSVVQVPFNAWNYAEAELWASLVAHIFESLHHHFSPPGQGENEEWRKLLFNLDAAQQGQGNAAQQLKLAEDELAEARARQNRRENDWVRASKTAWDALRAGAEKDSELAHSMAELEKTFHGEELSRLRLQLWDHKTGVANTLESMAARRAGVRELASWPAVTVALGIGALTLVAFQLGAEFLPETLSRFSERFGEVLAVAGLLMTWAGAGIRKAGSVVSALGAVEKAVREGKVPKGERMKLEAAEAAVGRAEEELEDQRRRVMELQARVETASPVRRLSRFLAERAESSDYRKHLGLPALARRDFEELGKLMNTPFRLSKAEVSVELEAGPVPKELRHALRNAGVTLPETPTLTALQGDGSWSIRSASGDAAGSAKSREVFLETTDEGYTARVRGAHIDRIILYIDDLDRCRAERVVEVLEAVHLLLALPLFVVVVGVDARWVEKALREHHSDLWSAADNSEGEAEANNDSRPGAEPQDYLEKIFQVPLWLQPMPEAATKRLLKDLVGEVDTEEDEGQEDGDGTEALLDTPPGVSANAADDVADRGGVGTAGKRRGGELGDSDGESDEPETSAEAGGIGHEEDTFSEVGSEAGADISADEAQKQLLGTDEAIPRGLLFTGRELAFIEKLAPVIRRSPRTAKRFVNAYRVLRASQPSWRLDTLVGTPETDDKARYRPVLLLLAAVVGCPREARELLSAAVRGQVAGSFRNLAKVMQSKSNRREWAALVELLPKGGHVDEKELRYWAQEVGRYSFRYGTGLGDGPVGHASPRKGNPDAGIASAPGP